MARPRALMAGKNCFSWRLLTAHGLRMAQHGLSMAHRGLLMAPPHGSSAWLLSMAPPPGPSTWLPPPSSPAWPISPICSGSALRSTWALMAIIASAWLITAHDGLIVAYHGYSWIYGRGGSMARPGGAAMATYM